MIFLDTNVVSALMHDPPDSRVLTWLDQQPKTSIWTTTITVFEILSGLQVMHTGRRRAGLSQVFELILERMEHRIAAFDIDSARAAASLAAARKSKGKVVEIRDTMIAGIVLSHHASLATRNTTHFDDISATVINPWAA
jgi:toxin FitB